MRPYADITGRVWVRKLRVRKQKESPEITASILIIFQYPGTQARDMLGGGEGGGDMTESGSNSSELFVGWIFHLLF